MSTHSGVVIGSHFAIRGVNRPDARLEFGADEAVVQLAPAQHVGNHLHMRVDVARSSGIARHGIAEASGVTRARMIGSLADDPQILRTARLAVEVAEPDRGVWRDGGSDSSLVQLRSGSSSVPLQGPPSAAARACC